MERQASMERTKELEKLSLLEQKKTREDKQRQTRLIALKEAQQRGKQQYDTHNKIEERRPSTPTHRPTSARHRTNPGPSPLPPSPYIDDVIIYLFSHRIHFLLFSKFHQVIQQHQK